MPLRQHPDLPDLWLFSDARNDARLESALAALPEGSGFVFRHHHLPPQARRARHDELLRPCRARGHLMILAGDPGTAAGWHADGVYGKPGKLGRREGLLRFAAVHDAREVDLANRAEVDAMFLSPVFPTRSHPNGACLGVDRFHEIAARAECPVIALGGMTAERAADLGWPRWAAIDGLS